MENLRALPTAAAVDVVVALVDTGAEHCAMSPSAAARLGLSHLQDSTFAGKVGGIGSGSGRGFGRIHFAPIAFVDASRPRIAFDAAFDVLEWPKSADFDAIIGLDFLVRNRARLDLDSSKLLLSCPPLSESESISNDEIAVELNPSS